MNEYVNNVINMSFSSLPYKKSDIDYTINGYTNENKNELLKIAKKKKVLPVVGKFLCSINVDVEEWEKHYNFFKERNENVIRQVNEVFKQLHSKGINRIAVYENFGALLYSDTDIALYSSGDVDFYADVKDKKIIVEALEELGYVVTDDISHRRNLMTEFLKKDAVIRINIGWKVLRRYSLPINVETSNFINWNNLITYKDTEIRILPKDVLLYLCALRIAVHGYSRSPDVRLYIDITNVIKTNPNWDKAIEWAKKDKTYTKFSTVLYIANHLNGVKVPEKIISDVKNDKYAQKILKYVYNDEEGSLKYDPKGFDLLKLEAASDRRSFLGEVFVMLFPPMNWLREFYTNNGDGTFKIYKNYYKRLFRLE